MFCQVWLHCLQSHLSSDNEIEINIHEELDLHIKRMLVNLLYNSILCFSYSDIILVYTPAWFFFKFLIWFEKLKMAYTVSNLCYGFLHSMPHVLNIFYHNFSESGIAFSLSNKLSGFWLRFPCQHIHHLYATSQIHHLSHIHLFIGFYQEAHKVIGDRHSK